MGDWDEAPGDCGGCGRPWHPGKCEGLDCRECGASKTVAIWSGICENHDDWAECLACEAAFPLIAGVTVWDESDPSVGLHGTAFLCPACEGEDGGAVVWGMVRPGFKQEVDDARR
jgi:hypothetical protein